MMDIVTLSHKVVQHSIIEHSLTFNHGAVTLSVEMLSM